MSEHYTPETSEQLDQRSQADMLEDRGVDDILDEGYIAPEGWSVAQGFGNTAEEMRRGETLDQRLRQELPEHDPTKPTGKWNPAHESREVGSTRAGRLVAAGQPDAVVAADDLGIAGAAACAEEAAMHIINEDDLADDGDDSDV